MDNTIKQIQKNIPKEFEERFSNAINFAKDIYKDSKRFNGDTIFQHTLQIALVMQEIKLDTASTIACLLHEIKLDKEKEKYIKREFGQSVLKILKALPKIKKATDAVDTDPEIIIRYILNSNKDIRPLIIKIVDGREDMLTIDAVPKNIQKEGIYKAFNIYSPLAEYLNFDTFKKDIDERAFKCSLPEEYGYIEKKFEETGINSQLHTEILKELNKNMTEISPKPKVYGRIKSKYTTYTKLKKYEKEGKNTSLNTIQDLLAYRIIFDTEENCYKGVEKLLDHSEIDYEQYDDYLSNPKKNGYKALHLKLRFSNISPLWIEVQVLTDEMHHTNTYGSASHIAYKASKSRYANPTNKYSWVEDIYHGIMNCQNNSKSEYNVPIEADIFKEELFVFTPKSKIVALNWKDTVLDFAYKLHTHIGNSAVSAVVNGSPASLSTELKPGDVVEIKTDRYKTFQKEKALQYANSNSTKCLIKKYINKSLKK